MVMLLLAGCISNEWSNREYSFAQGFVELTELDKEFNASFKDERLNVTMVPLENIDALLASHEEMKSNIEKTKDSQDKKALLKFIDIRKNMVLAEKNFQLAENIGPIGLVRDGFGCGEAKYILDASYYYNETFTYARKAQFDLDDLLYEYRELPRVHELVGVNKNKTAFYKSALDDVRKIVDTNLDALQKNCKIKVVTK